MQYKAENKLDIFEFHDAELSLGCFDKNTLVFSATHLNIHKHTKQNPGDCDLEIERAVLRFEHMESVTFENRRPIENGNPVGEQIVLEGADAVKKMLSGFVKGIRVFALFEENRRIIMDCITDGIEVDFTFFTIAFTPQTTSVEWDAYIGPAWYET